MQVTFNAMSKYLFQLFLGCFAVLPLALAESTYVPMKVIQTEPVLLSPRAAEVGVTSGDVRVSLQVDDTGALTDYLVTAYSHPMLADSVVQALKRWKYHPAMIDGHPRSATVDLSIAFESKGTVVVSLTLANYVEMQTMRMRPEAFRYGAVTLRQLDRIPTPNKVVQPNYSVQSVRSPTRIVVQFYIDEQGRVRLPAVSRATNEANEMLSAAAVEAVSQWSFEPPTSNGTPVLVAARQEFNFQPKP